MGLSDRVHLLNQWFTMVHHHVPHAKSHLKKYPRMTPYGPAQLGGQICPALGFVQCWEGWPSNGP